MKTLVIFCLFSSVILFNVFSTNGDTEIQRLWSEFTLKFNKTYCLKSEESLRFEVFSNNLKTIEIHNAHYEKGNFKYKIGINKFSDITFYEFLTLNQVNESVVKVPDDFPFDPVDFIATENFKVPNSFDWRDFKAVSNVQDQKECGSCYAMAAISSIESQIFIKTGKLSELSVQEIIDCAQNYQTWGCEGGFKFRVFDYVKDNEGVSLAQDYAYTGEQGSCKSKNYQKFKINLNNYAEIPPRDEKLLMQALVKNGPIVVSLDINHESFMRYESGIFSNEDCSDETNHAMLLVGFGSEDGIDYWTVKNSYGVDWGELGYIRIIRNLETSCGIENELFFPVIDIN